MTHSRRSVLVAGATGAVALTAGCLDFVLGNESLQFEAERAAPSDVALAEADFEEYEIREETIEETVEAVVERDIEATYWISAYTRDVEVRDERRKGAAFGAVSTPEASVMGEEFNPVADMDNEEIIDEYGDELNDDGDAPIENIEHEETTSLRFLGEDREVDLFVGEREYEGEAVTVEVLISSFKHEEDYIVAIGSYPRTDSLRNALEATIEAEAETEAEAELDGIENGTDEEIEDDIDEAEMAVEAELEAQTEAELEAKLPDGFSKDVEALFKALEHPV